MASTESNFSTPRHGQGTFREFFTIVFRRRWIILGLFFTTTLVVAALVFSSTTTYVSSGRVLLKRGEHVSALSSERRIYGDWEQELGSEMELIKSEPVLQRARETLKAAPEADGSVTPLVAGSVDIEVMGKSNVIGIAYSDADPKVAQKVCNALMDAYVEFRNKNLGMVSYPKAFFDAELSSVANQLQRAIEQRRQFMDRAQVADIGEQRRTILSHIGTLRVRESDLTTDLVQAQTLAKTMRELDARPEVETPFSGNDGADALFELRRRIVEQESRIAVLLERYREDSPEVQNARQTVATLRAMADREIQSKIEVAESRAEVIQAQLKAVRTDIAGREAELAVIPDKEIKIDELDRTISDLRNRYSELMGTSDLARVTENTTPNMTVLVLDRPAEARPVNNRDWVRLALAPAFSLVVGLGIAFFIDGLDITVRTAGQAEEAVDVPVLASLSERRRRRA